MATTLAGQPESHWTDYVWSAVVCRSRLSHPRSAKSCGSLPELLFCSWTPASGSKAPANADRMRENCGIAFRGSTEPHTDRICNLLSEIVNLFVLIRLWTVNLANERLSFTVEDVGDLQVISESLRSRDSEGKIYICCVYNQLIIVVLRYDHVIVCNLFLWQQ